MMHVASNSDPSYSAPDNDQKSKEASWLPSQVTAATPRSRSAPIPPLTIPTTASIPRLPPPPTQVGASPARARHLRASVHSPSCLCLAPRRGLRGCATTLRGTPTMTRRRTRAGRTVVARPSRANIWRLIYARGWASQQQTLSGVRVSCSRHGQQRIQDWLRVWRRWHRSCAACPRTRPRSRRQVTSTAQTCGRDH